MTDVSCSTPKRSPTLPDKEDYGSVNFNVRGMWLSGELPLQDSDKVWMLVETDTFVDNNKSLHRIQVIQVMRDHQIVEFDLDLGPSENFPSEPLMIFSGGEDYAGDILAMAADLRYENSLQRVMQEHLEERNVITELLERAEQMKTFAERNPRTIRRFREDNK